MTATYDFIIPQGSTTARIFCLKDCKGLPVNLTGYIAKLTIRPRYGSKCVTDELTSEQTPDRMQINPKTAEIRCFWPAALTTDLPTGRFFYVLERTSADGYVFRACSGLVTID